VDFSQPTRIIIPCGALAQYGLGSSVSNILEFDGNESSVPLSGDYWLLSEQPGCELMKIFTSAKNPPSEKIPPTGRESLPRSSKKGVKNQRK
jgi:hypothetical protein